MLPARNGQDHIESLRDGRDVSINGERVADVTVHKAFRNAVRSAARLYDFQADPAHSEGMTFASPDSGQRVSRCWHCSRLSQARLGIEAAPRAEWRSSGAAPAGKVREWPCAVVRTDARPTARQLEMTPSGRNCRAESR